MRKRKHLKLNISISTLQGIQPSKLDHKRYKIEPDNIGILDNTK